VGFTDELIARAKKLNKKVVLPETEDERTLHAAARIVKEEIARVVLIGDPDQVRTDAKKAGADVSGCEILSCTDPKECETLAKQLFEIRKAKGLTLEQAGELVHDHLYFATMLLKLGRVDGYVAGATHSTGDNLRPGLQIVKGAPGIKTVSSFFLMVHPNPKWGENGVMVYSDCGMVEMPTAEQLADIAISAARSFKQLVGPEPRVAMLSYSTKGSAKSTDTEKVLKALDLAKQADPKLIIDGEMQFDAAVMPGVAERKCKGSLVGGRANVFIFPDLDAGNIAYKITERIGGAQALGPLVQGMAKPAHDLSRGCSADDIVKVAAITAIMAASA
jgi:phosphate acetyltransferase